MGNIQKNLFGEIEDSRERSRLYSQAILLRMKHDRAGKNSEIEEYTIKDVIAALELGFNYFTLEPIKNSINQYL